LIDISNRIQSLTEDHAMKTDESDLDALLDITASGPAESHRKPAFCIDSPERANWLVRRVLETRAYAIRVRTWAEQEQNRAERDEARMMYLFGRQLQDWAKQELAGQHDRRKSINLPAGIIGFRQTATQIRIDNQDAVMAWAREILPEAIIVKESLSKAAINGHFAATGEIPDAGITVEPSREKFYIR
jgi:phage host-nuclease inhibitor protein Gam